MKFKGMHKVSILLIILLMATLLAGCSSNQAEQVSQPAPKDTTITVTDMAGRDVVVPAEVKSVALVWGPSSSFVLALGKGDIVTGINYKSELAVKVVPKLADVPSVGKGQADLEAVAKVKPDVFVHKATDLETLDAVQALGIPSIGIVAETSEDLIKATELLGKVLGAEKKATELIAFYNEKNAFAQNLTKDITADQRKTALVMGSEIGKVAHGDMLQSFLVETAGGVNLAKDIEAKEIWPTVGTEQIFAWNPDFIFCEDYTGAAYKIEELKTDPSFAKLKAIENDNIAYIPAHQDLWDFPGVQSSLGTLWMLNQFYPEKYSEADFIKDVEAFYTLTYGTTFDREWLGY